MFAIIGIVIVFGAIVAGYLMEKGQLAVLIQPAELIIIGGAALGTLLIANPPASTADNGQLRADLHELWRRIAALNAPDATGTMRG